MANDRVEKLKVAVSEKSRAIGKVTTDVGKFQAELSGHGRKLDAILSRLSDSS